MNGQQGRRDIVRELFCKCRFDFVVETGTYRAVTTQFLLTLAETDVYSVETSERFYRYSRAILDRLPADQKDRIHLVRSDSRSFLRGLSADGCGFFYLDAHWGEDLPLWEEIRIIEDKWPRAVILIDDFKVPDDPGYGYDDYGPGLELMDANIPEATWTKRTFYYPILPSEDETGNRQGCIVIASEPIELSTLRRAGASPSASPTSG